jgi:GNAT superfamily N-acetyltransferase
MAMPARAEQSRERRAHLNLVDSSRQLFELDPGATVEVGDGWLFGAGTPTHPAISNAAFRIDDGLEAEQLLAKAGAFFAERKRGFSVWIRGDEPADGDLAAAAEVAGLSLVIEMPEMLLDRPVAEPPLPDGAELRRVASAADATDYWRVAASAYTSLGFPPEVFGSYEDHTGLLAGNVAAFLAFLDGRPAGIAMAIVSHGVAGIYWVGSIEEARGKGLGWATTAAAANAGFDLGADVASLQASPMGESLYAAMGFQTVFTYRLLMATPR